MKAKIKFRKFLKEAFFNDKKYSVITAGRRSGKTYNGILWLLLDLLKYRDFNGIHVDTTQRNLDNYVQRYYKPILKKMNVWDYCSWNMQKKILTLPYENYIDFGSSTEPENLEGFAYQRALLNEGGIIMKKDSLWENTLQPMFKGSDTKVRIIGTPKGKNKFFELYQQGKTGHPLYSSFHFTAYDSPEWTKEELDALKMELPPEVFNQEYMAAFIEGAGIVFRKIYENIHSLGTIDRGKPGVEYVMGVDLAKYVDFTVITVAEKNTKKVVFVDRFNQLDWTFQKDRIMSNWILFNKPRTIIDATGIGDPIFEDLKKYIPNSEPYKFNNTTKGDLIRALAIAFEQGKIQIPRIEVLISELELYEYEQSKTGTISYNAPDGFHDDCVISLALCNYIIQEEREFALAWI